MQTTKITQLQSWGITVLRVVTGTLFLGSGVHDLFVEDVSQLGSSLPISIIVVGKLVEIVCGAALVIGLFTRWVSVLLALIMLANIAIVHPPHGFVIEDTGFEYALLRLAASVTLASAGPGKVALDNVLAGRRGLR